GPAPSGRRALGDPWDDGGPALDRGVPASGRRRLREPWDAPEQAAPVADSGVSASGRRYLREPWDAGPGGVNGGVDGTGGRRHLAEPPPDPGVSGTGGRRRLREPEPPPARDGARAEPWAFPPDAGARPRPAAEHRIEAGGQGAAGWAQAFADRGGRGRCVRRPRRAARRRRQARRRPGDLHRPAAGAALRAGPEPAAAAPPPLRGTGPVGATPPTRSALHPPPAVGESAP